MLFKVNGTVLALVCQLRAKIINMNTGESAEMLMEPLCAYLFEKPGTYRRQSCGTKLYYLVMKYARRHCLKTEPLRLI